MTKPSRDIENLIAAIRQAHAALPDMRVGQLLVNALTDKPIGTAFYAENDVLAKYIIEFTLKQIKDEDDPN